MIKTGRQLIQSLIDRIPDRISCADVHTHLLIERVFDGKPFSQAGKKIFAPRPVRGSDRQDQQLTRWSGWIVRENRVAQHPSPAAP
jgi:hypothetical protein